MSRQSTAARKREAARAEAAEKRRLRARAWAKRQYRAAVRAVGGLGPVRKMGTSVPEMSTKFHSNPGFHRPAENGETVKVIRSDSRT